MTEYLLGPDGRAVGPELDELTETRRSAVDDSVGFFTANADRVRHFANRVTELGRSGSDTVITLIDVDDPSGNGKLLADMLMPDHDWQQYRDRGETPVARGLAAKDAFPDILAELGYDVAAHELASTEDLRVIVLYAETVQVMDVQFA